MGFWSKFGKAIQKGAAIVPVLPLPERVKTTVADVADVEQGVEKVIADVKPPKPAA